MSITSNPRVTAQLLAAQAEVGVDPFRILIAGQTGSDGSATGGTFYKEVQDKSNSELEGLFGTEGELINRIIRTLRVSRRRVSVWVLPLAPDGGGAAATDDLAFTGTATESKTMRVKAIDAELFTVTVDVVTGDTANDVALALQAELDALNRFPATTSIVTDTLTLTANDVGTIPNKWTVEIEDIPAGISVNTNSGSDRTQFSGGTTDPSTSGIFDTAGTTRFHTIEWPWESDYTNVQTFLEGRNTIDNAFLQGLAYIGLDDSEANIKSVVDALNSQNLVFMGNKLDGSGVAAIVTPPDWRVAEFAAIEALRLTEDAPISQYVTVTTRLDAIGGPGLASLALYNTPLARTDVADPALLFSDLEQDNLKDDGFTIIGVNSSATTAIMGPVVTTYKTTTTGDPDTSFKFVNYVRTGYLALELFFNVLKTEFSQFRLTDGDLVPGRAITNADQLKGRFEGLYKTLSGPEFTLTQAGPDAETTFSRNLSVTTDVATGKATFGGELPIVTQFREASITFQLAFTVGG